LTGLEARAINGPRPPHEPSDEELAARLAARDVSAFGQLYDRYVQTLSTLALHVLGASDAEEAVQEVFLRVWDRAASFEPSRGLFRTWFFSVARHHLFDRLRRRSVEQRLKLGTDLDALVEAAESREEDPMEQAWQRDRARAVRAALMQIPQEQRQVLYLAYFAGMSQSAIARELNSPLGTVKKRVQLGMRKLRSSLEDFSLFQEETRMGREGGPHR
jgi:RNA polymerase sigma-70 factor, ECF subfamily